MDSFLAFCPKIKNYKLTSKKVYKPIPSIWPTFSQIHQRELLKLHFDMLLSFSLILLILQRLLWFLWISIWSFFLLLTSEVFDKRSIRVRIESTWGLAILQTLFKNHSRFRPSARQFIMESYHVFMLWIICRKKTSVNEYARWYIWGLLSSFLVTRGRSIRTNPPK